MPDLRGGPPPWQQMPASAQSAQLPPSLLQMAQGIAPQLGGGGWGGEFSRGGGPGQEFGGFQAGPAPAYNPGTTQGGYNAVFDPRAPSSTGGWFTMADYLKDNPQQRGPAPSGTHLSTNNWRLLGNDPDNFMINGVVVNRRQIGRDLAPKSVLGTEGTGFPGYSFMGGGQWAYPFGSQGSRQGYIGSQPNEWGTASTPTY